MHTAWTSPPHPHILDRWWGTADPSPSLFQRILRQHHTSYDVQGLQNRRQQPPMGLHHGSVMQPWAAMGPTVHGKAQAWPISAFPPKEVVYPLLSEEEKRKKKKKAGPCLVSPSEQFPKQEQFILVCKHPQSKTCMELVSSHAYQGWAEAVHTTSTLSPGCCSPSHWSGSWDKIAKG